MEMSTDLHNIRLPSALLYVLRRGRDINKNQNKSDATLNTLLDYIENPNANRDYALYLNNRYDLKEIRNIIARLYSNFFKAILVRNTPLSLELKQQYTDLHSIRLPSILSYILKHQKHLAFHFLVGRSPTKK